MLAISRCFSALIAANPRFEPPELLLFVVGMLFPPVERLWIWLANAHRAPPFTSLIKVKQLKSRAFRTRVFSRPLSATVTARRPRSQCQIRTDGLRIPLGHFLFGD